MEKSLNFKKLSNFRFFWWFVLVNAGVVATLAAVTQGAALPMTALVVIFGSTGSVFTLLLSRWLAVKAHSIVRIDDRQNHEFGWLVDDVREISRKAGLKVIPQVGVWPGPDANAFATGPSPKRALVAFSTPLLEMLTRQEVKAVAAHEVAHIANRDMLAMTMLQGVINSFVLIAVMPIQILRIFNFFSRRFSWGVEFGSMLVKFLITVVLTFLGSLVVKAFSRRREYRADAMAARLVAPEHMKSALERLAGIPAEKQKVPQTQAAYAAFKINGRGIIELLSTHPLVEKRIKALEEEIHDIGNVEK